MLKTIFILFCLVFSIVTTSYGEDVFGDVSVPCTIGYRWRGEKLPADQLQLLPNPSLNLYPLREHKTTTIRNTFTFIDIRLNNRYIK